jgi:hypothetical protein
MEPEPSSSLRGEGLAVAWRMVVGAGTGAMVGVVAGGLGGRLVMLLLRLASPDLVIGVTSDDGFVIGSFTLATFNLLLSTAFLGGVNGVLYVALRGSIQRAWRLPLWALFGATAGGATIVHDDGIDFTLLDPALMSILLFVALPGVASALVVVLVERWVGSEPFVNRRLAAVLAVGTILGTFAAIFAGLVGVLTLAARRAGVAHPLQRVARVVVPLGLVVLTAVSLVDLLRTSARIL